MIYAVGATSVSVDVLWLDDSGLPVTGKVAADFTACKWSSGTNTADTTITLSDLAAITTAHPNDNTAGGIKEREGGVYRVDVPNNVFTAAGHKAIIFAYATGKNIFALAPLDIQNVQVNAIQLAGQTITAAAGVTFPTSIASPTNITAGTITTVTTVTNQLTAAAIATGVWQDTTAGDFTTLTSPGKIIFAQLGGAFTTTSSSVFSSTALANAPTSGTPPTVSQIATAVWQDATAGDFTVSSSIGKSLYTSGAVPGAAGGLFIAGTNAATVITTSLTTHLIGTVDTVTTTTNLTNAPTSGDFTATMKASITTAATAATPTVADTSGTTTLLTRLTAQRGSNLDNLDVAVSTRSTYAGGDTSGTTTLLGRLTSPRATLLDNLGSLDVAVSTRSTYAGGDTSGTTALLTRLTSTRADLLDNLDAAISTRSTYAGGAVASVTGAVGSVAAAVVVDLTGLLGSPRNLGAVADSALTINDALHCSIAAAAGKETVVGTSYTVKTPFTGTTIRVFTLDSAVAPTSRT